MIATVLIGLCTSRGGGLRRPAIRLLATCAQQWPKMLESTKSGHNCVAAIVTNGCCAGCHCLTPLSSGLPQMPHSRGGSSRTVSPCLESFLTLQPSRPCRRGHGAYAGDDACQRCGRETVLPYLLHGEERKGGATEAARDRPRRSKWRQEKQEPCSRK